MLMSKNTCFLYCIYLNLSAHYNPKCKLSTRLVNFNFSLYKKVTINNFEMKLSLIYPYFRCSTLKREMLTNSR